jgi:hypothetical protein
MIREIKEHSITHLSCLITGDRFYCWSDVKKEKWELRFHTTIKYKGKEIKLSQCVNDKGEKRKFDFNRVVMFLKRTAPPKPIRIYDPIDRFFA